MNLGEIRNLIDWANYLPIKIEGLVKYSDGHERKIYMELLF
ncbi:hypothetical protein PL321_05265 [Caloramator sp. mosi_1]|nr:hypothetical protein [Caloramator sp. mosi_1]WDC84960.1 hypothetical protein PL321_05265 [Caloramator sp. mosi_1]